MKLPDGFADKYRRLLGAEADGFLATFDEPATSGFRVNPLRPDPTDVNLSLSEPIPYSEWGYYGKVDGNAVDHVSGYVYSQEPSAQMVGAVASPQPGMRVLDLCAAPGGKSTHLASAMRGQGLLVSNEINAGRARVLSSNLERFGVANAIVTNNDPDTLAKAWPETFDMILVDAPCSGEGMFRKDHDAVQYWTPTYNDECAARQRDIVAAAFKMLAPGGTLVYSTCTFAPEEDEQIVAWLLDNTDLAVVPLDHAGVLAPARPEWADGNPAIAGAGRLWPQSHRGEGHFVARLQRPGKLPEHVPGRNRLQTPTAEQRTLWSDFADYTLVADAVTGDLAVFGDYLYAMPHDLPRLKGVRVTHPGLQLGEFKKRRFVPSHSLATALPPVSFHTTVELTDAEFGRYRHGETVRRPDIDGRHFALITNQGKGFALGHLVNGTVKNLVPKGLRV
ncbi:RsmB/NOP family class I SAM-dependent RNA methyltransferase [Lacticaseibacillus pantheris]|uniref:RsmB/NOP family class I SAM-dependent RNA methyltransferase n=1 Tax=Lacticaseibacillus pantheris TaxID=171523 RepID=UPI00265B410C|nr:RsmF rRNA methyltransferase first C-terminal domain-containing protein [Lacticaseibacillus pantheris]WKF84367.1 RsmF rRNA methyltransferase first C-terminal domain-containing protein [Lacticaseibacillus pantheris]